MSSFYPHLFPLISNQTGAFEIEANLGGVQGLFLVDTGASMVTVEAELLNKIRKTTHVRKIRSVAARLANGRAEILDIFLVEEFWLGEHCNLGPIEVAAPKQGGRNLFGMNALKQAAPFGFASQPPTLGLSHCNID
ncbi:MAG: retroviral-like aspartic protease family protein [Pseudomonadales bacterium]|nr:retroviral-like aspartic protease family protein [Pseudomonadales bacterium]